MQVNHKQLEMKTEKKGDKPTCASRNAQVMRRHAMPMPDCFRRTQQEQELITATAQPCAQPYRSQPKIAGPAAGSVRARARLHSRSAGVAPLPRLRSGKVRYEAKAKTESARKRESELRVLRLDGVRRIVRLPGCALTRDLLWYLEGLEGELPHVPLHILTAHT